MNSYGWIFTSLYHLTYFTNLSKALLKKLTFCNYGMSLAYHMNT